MQQGMEFLLPLIGVAFNNKFLRLGSPAYDLPRQAGQVALDLRGFCPTRKKAKILTQNTV